MTTYRDIVPLLVLGAHLQGKLVIMALMISQASGKSSGIGGELVEGVCQCPCQASSFQQVDEARDRRNGCLADFSTRSCRSFRRATDSRVFLIYGIGIEFDRLPSIFSSVPLKISHQLRIESRGDFTIVVFTVTRLRGGSLISIAASDLPCLG